MSKRSLLDRLLRRAAPSRQVVSWSPEPDWFAVHRTRSGRMVGRPLIAWALVEDPRGPRALIGVLACGLDGDFHLADEVGALHRYRPSSAMDGVPIEPGTCPDEHCPHERDTRRRLSSEGAQP